MRQQASTAWYLAETIFAGQVAAVVHAVRPVLGQLLEMRLDRVERQRHLRHRVLDLRVVGHRAAHRERGLVLDARHGEIDRPPRDAVIDVGEARQRPGEDAQHERVHLAGRHDARDVLVGHEGAVQHHVVAACRAHAQRVPGLDDAVAVVAARQEGVHDLRPAVGIGPDRVQAVARPYRRQAAEHLVAGEAEPAVHPLGRAGGQQDRKVVAALGVAGVEHLARHRLLQQPLERAVAAAPQIGDQPDPVEVHVDAERRSGRVIGEPALLAAHLGEVQAAAAQFLRHRHRQIAGAPQVVEVLLEEAVLAVVDGAPAIVRAKDLSQHARRTGRILRRCPR